MRNDWGDTQHDTHAGTIRESTLLGEDRAWATGTSARTQSARADGAAGTFCHPRKKNRVAIGTHPVGQREAIFKNFVVPGSFVERGSADSSRSRHFETAHVNVDVRVECGVGGFLRSEGRKRKPDPDCRHLVVEFLRLARLISSSCAILGSAVDPAAAR